MDFTTDLINDSAPYNVYRYGENLHFRTESGTVYEVGFVEDYTIMEEDVYQFFISVHEGIPTRRDKRVKETIWAILESFFDSTKYGMLYICDTADGKQVLRSRLFNMWYNDTNKIGYTLI